MPHAPPIATPNDPRLQSLTRELAEGAEILDGTGVWPAENWRRLAEGGVLRWFTAREWGGLEWSEPELIRGYLALSRACLTTAFILTQWSGAVRRIAAGKSRTACQELLPDLLQGNTFATVGISHLSTSRRHLGQAVLRAAETPEGFVLEGYSPWVTGGSHADTIVVGATLDDGRQVLLAAATDVPGVELGEPAKLVALSASHTGEVRFRGVAVPRNRLLAGPAENVMGGKAGANTGGLPTSALALGLAAAAIDFLQSEAFRREELTAAATAFADEQARLVDQLLLLAGGADAVLNATEMRTRANSIALRASQAALAAAKGTGFVQGHPAGRWCREALFFLVWSCPQPVVAANLCELAGMAT